MTVIRSTTSRRRARNPIPWQDLPARIHAKCVCGQLLGTLYRPQHEDGTFLTVCLQDGEEWFEHSTFYGFNTYPGELYGLELVQRAKASIGEDILFKVNHKGIPDPTVEARKKWSFDCPNRRCNAHHSVMPSTLTRLVIKAVQRGDRHVVVP